MSKPVPRPSALYRVISDSVVFRWENQTLRADLILTLPLAVCLGAAAVIRRMGFR